MGQPMQNSDSYPSKNIKRTFEHTKIDTGSFSLLIMSGILSVYPNMEIHHLPA